MNSRIRALRLSEAQGEVKELLNQVQAQFGAVPNIFGVAANSQATLAAMLNFFGALSSTKLSKDITERIAVMVAQQNGCDYCLSAHTHIAKSVGVSDSEIRLAREIKSEDSRIQSVLQFAHSVLVNKGHASNEEWNNLKELGFSDEELLEIVSNVCLNVFTNYINNSSKTEIDFPVVSSECIDCK
jgi:uncharacterized peroxidase-related enzyme